MMQRHARSWPRFQIQTITVSIGGLFQQGHTLSVGNDCGGVRAILELAHESFLISSECDLRSLQHLTRCLRSAL